MNYCTAINHVISENKKARRKEWPADAFIRYIADHQSVEWGHNTHPFLPMYFPCAHDIFADDWEIME